MCHVFECVTNITIFIVIFIDITILKFHLVKLCLQIFHSNSAKHRKSEVKCFSQNCLSFGRYYFVPKMDCLRACLVALFSQRKVKSETEGGSESLAFGENLGIGRDSSGAVFGRSIDEQELEKVNCWPYFEISQRELLPQYSNQPLQAC